MHSTRALITLAVCITFNAYAGNSPLDALTRAQEICVKYPTPQARAECNAKQKATDAALARQQDQERRQAGQTAPGSTTPKKNDLCFTRKSTGEVVCPN